MHYGEIKEETECDRRRKATGPAYIEEPEEMGYHQSHVAVIMHSVDPHRHRRNYRP